MDARTLLIAVVGALTALGHPNKALAPIPSKASMERMEALAPAVFKPAVMVSYADFQCLALNVYHEARGESPEGQLAVAHVTLNRVGKNGFPDSICGVVQQGGRDGPCQFDWYCTKSIRTKKIQVAEKSWHVAEAMAARALAGGIDPTRGALYFRHIKVESPPSQAVGKMVIGNHVFYRLRMEEPQLANFPD